MFYYTNLYYTKPWAPADTNKNKFLRKKEALTQEQLATKIGVKRAMIGAYEEGRAEPRLHTLQHLAAYFQVRLDDFVNKDYHCIVNTD